MDGVTRQNRVRRWGLWLAGATSVLALMLATGCGSDGARDIVDTATDAVSDSSESFDEAGSTVETAEDAAEEVVDDRPLTAPEGREASTLGGGGTNAQVDPASLGREIIYTADLTVAVDDVAVAGEAAARIVGEQGGLLFGQETYGARSTGEGTQAATSRLTFRVRPADFQKVLGGLSALGEVRDQVVSTEDVTGRVVDLESRITTSETSVERIRELLGTANDVETVTVLEQQLLERETTLEVMRGQLRQLRDRVDLATIHLTLTEALANPRINLSTSWYVGSDEGAACPGNNPLVDEGDDVTICFEVVNTGDAPVAAIELVDTVLDIDQDALMVVFGDPDVALQPGQTLLWGFDSTLERAQRLRTRVSATPVNGDGGAAGGRVVQASSEPTIAVAEDSSLPGFTDAVSGGFGVLRGIGQILVLAIGALIPFLWIVPLAWLGQRYLRSRRTNAPPDVASSPRPAASKTTPPPPSPAVGDATNAPNEP